VSHFLFLSASHLGWILPEYLVQVEKQLKEVYSKFNDQGKELELQNRALAGMTEKFDEATKAAEESERFDRCIDEW